MTLPSPSATLSPRTSNGDDQLHWLGELIENAWRPLAAATTWAPPVDIEEQDDAWIVEAEIPGTEADDVNVDVRGSDLVISGDIKERERKGILRRRARRTGAFMYRVTLPGDPDPEAVEARLDQGVLHVRVPKRDRTEPRRIQVQSG